VADIRKGGNISYEHIDDLSRYDMRARTTAQWAEVAWLNERVARRMKAADFPATQAALLRIHTSF
jgi:hypothetical protein